MKIRNIFLFCIILGMTVFFSFPILKTNADNTFPEPLNDWSYRKKHTINSSLEAGGTYQVKFNIYYASGVDSGENVFLNGHCQVDFDDIRFTASDGKSELDYWFEMIYFGESAIIWVEISANPISSISSVYLYYGNLEVSTTSNGENTFLLFDDFEDGMKQAIWKSGGNPNEAEGKLTCTGVQSDFYQSYQTFLYAAATALLRVNGTGTTASSYFGFNPNTAAGVFPSEMFYFDNDEDDPQHRLWSGTVSEAEYTNISQIEEETKYEILWTDGLTKFVRNGLLLDTHMTYVSNSAMPLILESYHTSGFIEIEWVFVRNYTYPEPMHEVWSIQEYNVEPGMTTSSTSTTTKSTLTTTADITSGISLPLTLLFVLFFYFYHEKRS